MPFNNFEALGLSASEWASFDECAPEATEAARQDSHTPLLSNASGKGTAARPFFKFSLFSSLFYFFGFLCTKGLLLPSIAHDVRVWHALDAAPAYCCLGTAHAASRGGFYHAGAAACARDALLWRFVNSPRDRHAAVAAEPPSLHMANALRALLAKQKRVLFIGDSVMDQVVAAAHCEWHKQSFLERIIDLFFFFFFFFSIFTF